jgi:probable addiction module antidote protein
MFAVGDARQAAIQSGSSQILPRRHSLECGAGDPTLLVHALGVVARAKRMTDLAKETGMGRESLYKSLSSDGNPSFSTVIKVLSALGVKHHAMPADV